MIVRASVEPRDTRELIAATVVLCSGVSDRIDTAHCERSCL